MTITPTTDTIVAGDSFAFSGRDMNADEDGTPTTGIDLTGYAVSCAARIANGGALLTQLSLGSGITLQNQAAPETKGGFDIAFLPAQTALWPAGRAVELDIKIALGNEVTHQGKQVVQVYKAVTP